MNRKFTLLAILLAFMLSVSFGQTKISGTVVDSGTQNSIEFANIALMKQDSTFVAGASSDTLGLFAFNNIPTGDYILSATFVGYDKTYIPVKTKDSGVDLGKVSLSTSDIALKDVTVTANAIVQKADRRIIVPSTSQVAASNSGVTLLRNLQLSRIIVNPISNAITVPGGEAVQLRINGVEVSMEEVVALQPADVIRIEYHDEPGMRYGNVPAVIDYITRRRESGGNVSANLGNNAPWANLTWGENYVAAKVNHKKSEFSVNAYYSLRKIEWIRENTETFVFPDKTLERVEDGTPTELDMTNFNFTANYNLNEPDKYLFNASFRYKYRYSPNEFADRNSVIHSSDNSAPLAIKDHSTWRNDNPSLDLYYQRNLGKDQILVFNVVGTYISSKSTRLYQESRLDELTTDIFSSVLGDKYSLIGEGIYEKTFKSGKLSAGLKHSQSYTNNVYGGNVSRDVSMSVAETYAFAEFQWKKNKFNYSIGMGVMRNYNSQGGESNEKYILRPRLRISYNINDNAYVRLNTTMSGYSPSLSYMNDVEQAIDSLQIRRGNPWLKTFWSVSNTLNAGYNKGMFGVELYAKYTYEHQPIMENITFENGKFIRTSINQKAFHRLYTELAFQFKPLKDHLSISIAPGLNRYISLGETFTHTYSHWRVRASLSANYKKWMFSTEWYPRWNDLQGETLNIGEETHMVLLGYNTKKWSASVMMFNPFMNYMVGSRNYSKLAPNVSNVYNDTLQRTIILSFTLNLNFGRQYKAGNKRLNNDDSDAGIMSGSK